MVASTVAYQVQWTNKKAGGSHHCQVITSGTGREASGLMMLISSDGSSKTPQGRHPSDVLLTTGVHTEGLDLTPR